MMDSMKLKKVNYQDLNARQQENYNFHQVAAVLAQYGFTCLRLSDDWQGADFIAIHIDGETDLKVQLKGRLTFMRKYLGKNLYICFPDGEDWYLYPHDDFYEVVSQVTNIINTKSWKERGEYHFPKLSEQMKTLLADYRL